MPVACTLLVCAYPALVLSPRGNLEQISFACMERRNALECASHACALGARSHAAGEGRRSAASPREGGSVAPALQNQITVHAKVKRCKQAPPLRRSSINRLVLLGVGRCSRHARSYEVGTRELVCSSAGRIVGRDLSSVTGEAANAGVLKLDPHGISLQAASARVKLRWGSEVETGHPHQLTQ